MVDLIFYAIFFGVAVIAGFFSRDNKVPFWLFLGGWIAFSLFFGVHETRFGGILLTGLIGGVFGYGWNQEHNRKVQEPESGEK